MKKRKSNYNAKLIPLLAVIALLCSGTLSGCMEAATESRTLSDAVSEPEAISEEPASADMIGEVTSVGESYFDVKVYTAPKELSDYFELDLSTLTESEETSRISYDDDTECLTVKTGYYVVSQLSDITVGEIIVKTMSDSGIQRILILQKGTPKLTVSFEHHGEVQAAIKEISEKYGATGVQVAVIEQGKVTDAFVYGWATYQEEKMTVDHKVRVASVSKVILGITAMLLQEDGIVDLDEDFGVYWGSTAKNPNYPDHVISLRDIMHHTSSILCYGDSQSKSYDSVRSCLSGFYNGMEPGVIESYEYNNYAFCVLGMTLELAADRTIDDIIQEKLLGPLNIDAAFGSGDIEDTDKLVTIYRLGNEVNRSIAEQKNVHMSETPGADGTWFAGGFTISAVDLAKIIAMLGSDGEYYGKRYLSADSVEQMETYIGKPKENGAYQATPLFYRTNCYGREGIYFHDGSAYGAETCVSYDPLTGDGFVVLTTGTGCPVDDYCINMACSEINAYVYSYLADPEAVFEQSEAKEETNEE